MPEGRDLITVSEAAAELGLSTVGVARRLQRGHMRGIKVSPRLWLVERAEVDRAKAAGRLKPGPKRPPESATEVRTRENAEHLEHLDQERRRIRGETD